MADDRTHEWGSEWDRVADVVVVGSGAAAFAAALTAAREGADVVMLERGAQPGGTTAKSGGGFWIPNNSHMREAGVADPKDAALRYLARLGFPAQYDPSDPTLGLDPGDHRLLEVFYDHAAEAIEALEEIGALYVPPRSGPAGERPAYPDYHADLPENGGILGRSLGPGAPPGMDLPPELLAGRGLLVGGAIMIETMRRAAERLGVTLLLEHRVVHGHRNPAGAVVGVEAHARRRTVLVGARQAVIFGSGGFLLNRRLAQAFLRGPVFGGCAADTNTGDFVDIGIELGAELGNMGHAWWDQVAVEVATRVPSTAEDIWVAFGDSMIQVDRFGRRAVNEKQVYNERGQVHFHWDPSRREYPNLLLFQIWDDAVARNDEVTPFRGLVPMPGEQVSYVVTAPTLEELAAGIDERLAGLTAVTGGVRLDPSFAASLYASVERFNAFADKGVDEDFGRGDTPIQRAWAGPGRPGSPNPCMAPIAGTGPYHAMIVGAGALDTKGGPRINERSQVISTGGEPIPGLYGAGNCIACPLGQGYPGAGGTIGPALTFGYLAGLNAAKDERRTPA
ncbi:MAG TPA: FAD-dependent oxidoreductase [Acidimicrobiales bacterium]|nr:FAD-dependent oxidoreductase [Acidimicrobiales bacterium]